MGSIVGAVYAQSGDAQVTESKIKEFLQSSMFQQSQTEASQQGETGSFLEQLTDQICREKENAAEMRASIQQRDEAMASALTELLGDARIEDCAIPYAAVASDLLSGEEVVLKQGPLVQAVLASSALPGILSPVPLKEFLLVDGAATSSVPVRAARSLNAKLKTVAVDVSAQLSPHPDLTNFFQIIMRSSAITGKCYQKQLISEADVLIQPHVKLFNWSEFQNIDDFIAEGEQAAVKKISQLRKATRVSIL